MKLAEIGYELDIKNKAKEDGNNYPQFFSGLSNGIDDECTQCNRDIEGRSGLR